jgi:hypothetical protein
MTLAPPLRAWSRLNVNLELVTDIIAVKHVEKLPPLANPLGQATV